MDATQVKATLAGGCFWCLEAVFTRLDGVSAVVSGYTGGDHPSPSYAAVCTGATGHAEAVQITFDPRVIPYRELLEVFFAFHDPTTPNRQGPDVGTQYRSVVFTHDDEQRAEAVAMRQQLDSGGRFRRPIVTEIVPASTFWRAEEYHQKYVQKRGGLGCHL